MTMLRGSKQSGYSLIEALVAVAILGALLTFITLFSSLNRTRIDSTLHNTCRQLAQASLDNLRSTGFEKGTAPANIETNQINFATAVVPPIVQPSDILPPGNVMALMEQVGAMQTLNNYRTIIGSMTVLSGVYNSNPAFCTNPQGLNYAGGTSKLLADSSDQNLRNVSSTVRIQRFNIATGVRDCPPGPIYFRPAAEKNDGVLNTVVNRPANVYDEHGLVVTVTTQYTDPSNVVRSCQMSATFQYPRMNRTSNVLASASFITSTSNYAACQPSMTDGTLTINAAPNFANVHGVTMLCRDASFYEGVASGAPIGPLCLGEGGATGAGVSPRAEWVQCPQVTACGLNPSSTGWAPSGAPMTLVNNYNGIPWGCHPRIEVRMIDPALNTTDVPVLADAAVAPAAHRFCESCPPTWTGPDFCPPYTYLSVCTPPPPPPEDPPSSGGGSGGGDGSGPADGGDCGGGGTDGADG